MKKMLIVSCHYYPHFGGIEQTTRKTAEMLTNAGIGHTLISYSTMKDTIEIVTGQARLRPIDANLQVPGRRKFKAQTSWKPQMTFEITMHDLLNHWRTRVGKGETFLTR